MAKQEQKKEGKKTTRRVSNAEAKALMREFVKTELFPNKEQPALPALPDLAGKVIQKITDKEKKK